MIELVPAKATFAPGEPLEIEVRGSDAPVELSLLHLEREVAKIEAPGAGVVTFPAQPEGGYGVEAPGAATAVEVLANPLERVRYGFVASYAPGRNVDTVVENVRRLHLSAVQFYDWMYRHAQLVPPTDVFEDALGQTVSLDSSRRLAAALREAGSLPIAYAAVYAAGKDEWPDWEADGLFRPDGTPWTLGEDFLWNVDPTSERWLTHFVAELQESVEAAGFAGFHLDQYGQPKRALRKDGTTVDLSDAFPALLERLARELPESRLIFNNVNDFPTWTTARATQSAIYIEVWAPHIRLGHLAELVTKARGFDPDKPIILAAYLNAYDAGDEAEASAAERLQHAVVFSHGGTVLLHGESRNVLTEAYYVSNHELGDDAHAASKRCYDFAVRYGDLLFDRGAADMTRMVAGGINQEVIIEADVPVATDCQAGSLWMRVVGTRHGLVVHLIDLSQQDNDLWDAPKKPARLLTDVRLAVERYAAGAPRIEFAHPEQPALVALEPAFDGRHDRVELPAFGPWAIVLVRDR